ncbi:MAG: PDZ domain-containing protein [Acidobacteriota bacterium]
MKTCRFLAILAALPALCLAEPTSPTYPDDVPKVFFGYGTRYQEKVGDTHGYLRVRRIESDGPANRAGLREGDEIIAFNGVPFRFENDVQAIRAMAWVEAGKPLELTVRRGGQTLDLTMVPTAAEPERQIALARWLDRLEQEGRACFRCQDEGPDAAEAELLRRIREVGGEAVLKVERDGDDIRISSSDVRVPPGLEIDPAYAAAARRLSKGKALLLRVKVDGNQAEWWQEGAPGFR